MQIFNPPFSSDIQDGEIIRYDIDIILTIVYLIYTIHEKSTFFFFKCLKKFETLILKIKR